MSKKRNRLPQGNYGILVGQVKDGRMDAAKDPHYEIWVSANGDYRVAVNAQSDDDTEVRAYWNENFASPTKLNLPQRAAGPFGYTALQVGPDGQGLDYVRDNLFPLDQMQLVPAEGGADSLATLLDQQVARAQGDAGAVVLACGDFYKDTNPPTDPVFGFSPSQGVHDIHMMQGDTDNFVVDDRVNGDGALFFRYSDGTTVALFVRFQTQTSNTDNQTGRPARAAGI